MNNEPETQLNADSLEEFFQQLINAPKRQYTQQEIDEARGELALMNDRVFLMTFIDNKNNPIITGIANSLRKIHGLSDIPPIEQSVAQNISLIDVLGRGMIGDLFGWGEAINIAIEAQRKSQDDYAVRGTLTSGNAMRFHFDAGDDYSEAPDVIGLNILGFRLPELAEEKMFCSRIVRAVYDSKKPFLADKYSDYYVELPKMDDWSKATLPKQYHDLWDICCIFRAKVKEHEEVIRMQAITNPTALDLSRETNFAVTSNDVVTDTLSRKSEYEKIKNYFMHQEKKAEKNIAQKTAEEMLLLAIRSNAPHEVIEVMRKGAGISEIRFVELMQQA